MKKTGLISLFMVLIFVHAVDAQQPIYDAVTLSKIFKTKIKSYNYPAFDFCEQTPEDQTCKDFKTLMKILRSYKSELSSSGDKAVIVYYKNNPFFKGLKDYNADAADKTAAGEISSVAGASPGLNVASVADGIAKFLVKRTKEELTITFFTRFKKDLMANKDLQILFPSTYSWLLIIDTEIYNYSSYLTMLRESFIKDLQVIIPNLKKVLMDDRYEPYLKAHQPLRDIFLMALAIVEGLQHGEHPGDILHDIAGQLNGNPPTFDQLASKEPNLTSSLRLMDVLVQSLKSKKSDSYLVKYDSIRKVLLDPANDFLVFRIYCGLIYEQTKDINFTYRKNNGTLETVTVSAVLTKAAGTLDTFRNTYEGTIKEIISRAELLENAMIKIKAQNQNADTKATYQEYYAFYDATMNLLEYAYHAKDIIDTKISCGQNTDTYFFVARRLGEMYVDVNQKKLASVILNASIVYDTLFNKSVTPEIQVILDITVRISKMSETEKKEFLIGILPDLVNGKVLSPESLASMKALADGDAAKLKDGLKNLISELIKKEAATAGIKLNKKTVDTILKYGNFAAQVASAENSDQVESAIESIALPPGSSAIKASSCWSISLNGYLGFGAGWRTNGPGQYFGISAPIGLAINKSTGWDPVGSLSIFGSIIDVGAFATYHFTDPNGTVAPLPELTFKNILAPGGYVVLGRIFNTPLAIMVGEQYGPSLQAVSATGATIEDAVWRFNVALTVDIPIFNFYVKPKN